MSLIKIEDYRGFEISFDTDKETFTAWSSSYDNETKEKQSYAATKKYVDDYLKDNQNFKPFFVFQVGRKDKKQIIGIRKDMRFIDANKEQISDYGLADWLIWDESVTPKIEEYNRLAKIEEEARKVARQYRETAFANYPNLKQYKEANF